MATRLLAARKHVVAYLPNLGAVVRHFTGFTAKEASVLSAVAVKPFDTTTPVSQSLDKPSSVKLTKHDRLLPLPGNVGFVASMPLTSSGKCDLDLTFLNQFTESNEQSASAVSESSSCNLLEYVAQELPVSVRKDFRDLFPDRQLEREDLTVITLSQRTQNDMTSWSEEVEAEREQLLASFIAGASDICKVLQQEGYWADFIDPASGRPYIGAYTNSTLFETDERYRKLGFEINDIGCCKVISHHLWGSHAYVGSIFTNAPMDHPVVNNLMSKK